MAFTKVTNEDRQGKGNVGQPDTPLLTTTEMQEQMDSLSNLAIDSLNRLIDELGSENGASNIGCTVPSGVTASANMFSVLDALAILVKGCENAKHSHSNKALLDGLSEQTFEDINTVITLLASIQAIGTTVSDSSSELPTSLAVKTFVDNYDMKTKIRDSIFPVGSVYTTTLLDPDSIFGTSGKWTLLKTEDGIKFYKRTA